MSAALDVEVTLRLETRSTVMPQGVRMPCRLKGERTHRIAAAYWRSHRVNVSATRGSVEPLRFPFSVLEQTEILEDLVDCAERHFRNTGRYLQVWGELGEIYAEVKFGLAATGPTAPAPTGPSMASSSR